MTEAPAPLPPGARLAHYEVREVLGTGGMGTVYLAHDTALDRSVALKVLRPEIAGDATLVERFVLEARAAARVSHANLTHVHFVGNEGGRPFFAMEYCPGATLEWAVKEKGPFPLSRGLDVLVQAARGLAAAHGAGVVHRDVKPSNLMLLPGGAVKVTDFGLAKSLKGDVGLTGGRLVGTPTYMSPEQVRGKPVDARTDIYLLGLTGYFLFTGKPAFGSDQVGEVIHDQMTTPLPAASAARPDLPPALDGVLRRMCDKDPAKRPASMEEVARLLDGLRPRPLNPAPLVARGVAASVDWFVLMLVVFAIMALNKLFLEGRLPGLVISLLMCAAMAALLLLPEIRWGTGLGKTLFHLRVARADGTPPGMGSLAARYLLRYPLGIAITPGTELTTLDVVFWMLQGAAVAIGVVCYFFLQGRTLSDRLTGTRVVYRLPSEGVHEP
jgi:serine/threonine-protein kinase